MTESVFEEILVTEGAPRQVAAEPGLNTTPITAQAGIQNIEAFALVPRTQVASGNVPDHALEAASQKAGFNQEVPELLVLAREQVRTHVPQGRLYGNPAFYLLVGEGMGGAILRISPKDWF